MNSIQSDSGKKCLNFCKKMIQIVYFDCFFFIFLSIFIHNGSTYQKCKHVQANHTYWLVYTFPKMCSLNVFKVWISNIYDFCHFYSKMKLLSWTINVCSRIFYSFRIFFLHNRNVLVYQCACLTFIAFNYFNLNLLTYL